MEIKEMTMAELEERLSAIEVEMREESADLEALSAEVESIESRKKEIIAQIEERNKEAEKVASGVGAIIEERKEVSKMGNMEIRNTAAYINAFANYIKSEDDKECRSLLTENVSGSVPVPAFVEELIRTAWETEGIMSKVRKSYLAGNLKVGFEKSADGAVIHTEGTAAPTEETLVLGIVELVPQSIKKWITISDEAMDMGGEAFLRYIYNEVSYQIAKKAADTLVAKIVASPATSSATAPAVAVVEADTITASTIINAIALLSDEATNPVVIINKASLPAFKAVEYAQGYAHDIFESLEVIFNNSLPAFASAAAEETYAIVGDLDRGALANFPNGEEIKLKFDENSLAEKDLVKIVGREYVALGVVAPNCFTKIAKAELS